MHGLVRCKHERRYSRAHGAGVSFRDVTIKIPDRGCDEGIGWRHESETWAEIWEKSVREFWHPKKKVDFRSSPRPCGGCTRGEGGANGKVRCTSLPYVEKHFHSKVIKCFVPELRSRQVFFVFRDSYVIYICALWTLWTFYAPVWICLFHVSVSWVRYSPSCWSLRHQDSPQRVNDNHFVSYCYMALRIPKTKS